MGTNAVDLGQQVKVAMEAADLEALFKLMAPDLQWGPPDDPGSGCHNRAEARAWYEAAFRRGMRATVNEVVVAGDHLVLGLDVQGPRAKEQAQGSPRWQVLTVRDGLIADIRGFDTREEAARRAGLTT